MKILAWIASGTVIVSYIFLATKGWTRQFHLANALCAPPVIAIEITTGAWQALVLTSFFGATGAVGFVRESLSRRDAHV